MLIAGSTDEKNSLLFPSVEWHMIALMASPCSDTSNGEGDVFRAFFCWGNHEKEICAEACSLEAGTQHSFCRDGDEVEHYVFAPGI